MTPDVYQAHANAIVKFKRDAERNALALVQGVLGEIIVAMKTGDLAALEQIHDQMLEILDRD